MAALQNLFVLLSGLLIFAEFNVRMSDVPADFVSHLFGAGR